MKIVKKYYGGREISHEDLEAALLVGMSPNERRKFKKKRRASFKEVSIDLDNVPGDNSTSMLEPINHRSSEMSTSSGSINAKDQATSFDQLVSQRETNSTTPFLASAIDIREDAFAIDGVAKTSASSGISDVKDGILSDSGNICESRNPSEASDCALPNFDSKTCMSKVSLLGHGPHGKEVVNYLLQNYGEDGIHSFCQRWREVFVDALHPRYLPVGWDIKHR